MENPTWINSKRYDNDIRNLIAKFPDGIPDRIIANVLGLTEEELTTSYEQALVMIREKMGIDNEE